MTNEEAKPMQMELIDIRNVIDSAIQNYFNDKKISNDLARIAMENIETYLNRNK